MVGGCRYPLSEDLVVLFTSRSVKKVFEAFAVTFDDGIYFCFSIRDIPHNIRRVEATHQQLQGTIMAHHQTPALVEAQLQISTHLTHRVGVTPEVEARRPKTIMVHRQQGVLLTPQAHIIREDPQGLKVDIHQIQWPHPTPWPLLRLVELQRPPTTCIPWAMAAHLRREGVSNRPRHQLRPLRDRPAALLTT
jgi:hypothetical protein